MWLWSHVFVELCISICWSRTSLNLIIVQRISKQYCKEDFAKIGRFEIRIGIPLLVIGKNNGLLKVELKDDGVGNIKDIGYGVYLFSPNVLYPQLINLLSRSTDAYLWNYDSEDCKSLVKAKPRTIISGNRKLVFLIPLLLASRWYD